MNSSEPLVTEPRMLDFLAERHLATLTTLRANGTPHVAPVGFSISADLRVVRVITWSKARKVANVVAHPNGRAAVCQVDGGRWLTLEGIARATNDPDVVATAVEAYAARYRQPKERDDRWVIEITIDRVMGRA